METVPVDSKNVYYPPGGILMWIIIFLELFTFGMALVAMVYYGSLERELFHESRLLLNASYGAVNTVFLLTSGFFMAKSVMELKRNHIEKSIRYLWATMFLGCCFLVLKGLEYSLKMEAGLDMNYNLFFTFYWALTFFHVIHVLVGLFILGITTYNLKKNPEGVELIDVEAGAAFWHMCDLIWLLLFPIIYLIF
ncbi:MAG: cytochrome c oxidase subunit 3 [Flavobacteriaceae bacterium]|nr:cytochrome c oxidase subunit 3 [Flavobacteriaceae bacterium]